MPFISIIIPTYNSASTLEQCLNSIINQEFQDYEVLIIDALSKDRTLSIIENLKDDRIKIYSEKDEGIYDAMNKGINLAGGKWIYFLGSDDQLFNDNVIKDISIILSDTHHEVVYGNVKIFGEAGWASDSIIYDYEFDLEKILNKNICHQSIFYLRNVLINNLFDLSYAICSDYDLNLKLFNKYHFKYIDIIVAKFNGGGISKAGLDKNFDFENLVIKHFFNKLYLNEFRRFSPFIKSFGKNSSNFLVYMYCYLIYVKHSIFKTTHNIVKL